MWSHFLLIFSDNLKAYANYRSFLKTFLFERENFVLKIRHISMHTFNPIITSKRTGTSGQFYTFINILLTLLAHVNLYTYI